MFFVLIHVGKVFYRKVICCRSDASMGHIPTLVSTWITLMLVALWAGVFWVAHGASLRSYFLYLMLARATLDVFNCNPTIPPDPRGTIYMQATVVPCYVPGGPHLSIVPVAIIALAGES